MDKVLRAVLRRELPYFIRKVFATISPGETYFITGTWMRSPIS
jgi:hypothetical protein